VRDVHLIINHERRQIITVSTLQSF